MYRIHKAKQMISKLAATKNGKPCAPYLNDILAVLNKQLSLREISDSQFAAHLKEYVTHFIADRFEELPGEEMVKILTAIIYDAFTDGARFVEEQHVKTKKSKIII